MKVLVLCWGNVNRSALCGAVLAQEGFEVRSAGFLPPGRRATKKMREAAVARGYDLEQHRSSQVTEDLVKWSDAVLLMDNRNAREFERLFPGYEYLRLGRYLEPPREQVPDPAFLPRGSKFNAIVQDIIDATRRWAGKL